MSSSLYEDLQQSPQSNPPSDVFQLFGVETPKPPGGSARGSGGGIGSYLPRSPSILSAVPPSPRPQSAGNPCTRILSFRQLRDMIQEIYTSKARRDDKCVASRLPKETMEQHFYTFLTHRFGLRLLILEWASATLSAVAKFAKIDCDVNVFGKVLRNELPETFPAEQQRLRVTIVELLRAYLRTRHPTKPDGEVTEMIRRRVRGRIGEEEWVDIVKYIYGHEESAAIIASVKAEQSPPVMPSSPVEGKILRSSSGQTDPPHLIEPAAPPSERSVSFGNLLHILLQHQLEAYENRIRVFVEMFQHYDNDRRGVLIGTQFQALCLRLRPSTSERTVLAALEKMDPSGCQQVTFSDCIEYFISECPEIFGTPPRETHRSLPKSPK